MVEMITYDPEIFNETWNKISNVTEKRMKQYKLNTHLISGYRKDEEIPKEVRDDLISEGCPESWFSPVEKEFQEGDWIKHKSQNGFLLRYNGNKDSGQIGFNYNMKWVDGSLEEYSGVPLDKYRKATKDEIETALIAEAKRRGFPVRRWKHENHRHYFKNSNLINEWYYDPDHDELNNCSGTVYQNGVWASIIDEPIQINGYEVDTTIRLNNAGESVINIGCSHPPVYLIENLNQAIDDYDISIYREGEDITSKIKKIAERL